ncbi:UDP-Glucose Glycoprotein glucosylTransferase [Trichostrongylus colubriformis]|uniref:UDP-Glucose Glycoprotein glucosylTransferase n=1 Tax=Trichostrongylus colubriformis TaxID=6319 RepID=A0AAN8ENY0_TRICO
MQPHDDNIVGLLEMNSRFAKKYRGTLLDIEFMAKEDEQLFWRFISQTADKCPGRDWSQVSDEKKYETGIEQASKMLSPPLLDLLKLSLSLRVYSPTVQLFHQTGADYAMPCTAFFDVHGVRGCNVGELEKAMESAHERKNYIDSSDHIEAFKMHLMESQELGPTKQWQLQDLSFQAAQRVINEGENALEALSQLSQDFPLHARSLSRQVVHQEVRRDIELNQKNHLSDAGLEPGESALYLNGLNLDMDSLDLFQLFNIIRQEELVSTGFFNLGFRRDYLPILTNIDLSEEKNKYAVDYRSAYPMFLNNLDTDVRYKHWRNSVKLLLEPYYPGMIRPIARNLFTLIFVLDPAHEDSRKLLKMAHTLFEHEVPLRIGLLFAVESNEAVNGTNDVGVAILNLLNFLAVDNAYHDALRIVVEMLEPYQTHSRLDPTHIKTWFEKNYDDADYNEVFGSNSPYDTGRTTGRAFLEETGIGNAPKVLLNGFVLDDAGVIGDKFEETLMLEVIRVTQELQKAVMRGALHDQVNVGKWIMEQKHVVPRQNKRIIDALSQKNILDLTDISECKVDSLSDFAKLKDSEKIRCIAKKMAYVKKTDDHSAMPLTLWVVADLDSEHGRQIVYSAIKSLKRNSMTRLGIIMNPTNPTTLCEENSIPSLVNAAMRLLPHTQAKQFITKLVKENFANDLRNGATKWEDLAVGGMDVNKFENEKRLLNCEPLKFDGVFVRDVLKLSPGERAFIANGIIVGPFDEQETIIESDVELIARIVDSRGSSVIASQIDKWSADSGSDSPSDLVMQSFALVLKHGVNRKRTFVNLGKYKNSAVTLSAEDNDRAALNIVAVLDPLSRSAQKLSAILQLLRKSINCDVKIVLNPIPKLSELPLKRFYRYVAMPEIQFDKSGKIVENQARFNNLPPKQLLTLSVHSPDAWMVESVFAEYDLDNIRMEQVSSNIVALFSLEHILLEGHCFDEVSGSPPRGLQFVLGTSSQPSQFDTIVMANLGYFQLKANPGAWLLQLREGKSSEIYTIASHRNTEGDEDSAILVLIDSFSGRTIRVHVSKRKGMEQRSFLPEEGESDGIWNSISKSFIAEKYDVINVFSLASGQLYERFLNIMMVSVVKNTKKPVKFWLLKNYLSPHFKGSLPLLSRKYGFDYALVEYKWPRWLHQQKEKHRVMWGYKILFLDVLFPLDVQKIIFVDADQVVRADLMELMELDLGGAPYG